MTQDWEHLRRAPNKLLVELSGRVRTGRVCLRARHFIV
jgi:hypothetical protein